MEEYQQSLEETKQEEAALNQKSNRISGFRLFVFLAFLIGVGFWIFDANLAAGIVGLVFLAAFLVLVVLHEKALRRKNLVQARRQVLERCLSRFGEDWRELPDDGASYYSARETDFPQGADLDLFGPSSLYQYLCSAHTPRGKILLGGTLVNREPDRGEILRRQQAVRELSEKREYSLRLQTLGTLLETGQDKVQKTDVEDFLTYCGEPEPKFPRWRRWATVGLSAAALALIVLISCGVLPLVFLSVLILVCLLFLAVFWRKDAASLKQVSVFGQGLASYEELFLAAQEDSFHSPLLLSLQQELNGAADAFRRLKRIGSFVSMRNNAIMGFLLNALFLWDGHCAQALHGWKTACGAQAGQWLEALGQLEVLLSLASLKNSRQLSCFPEILEESAPAFSAEDLAHPLIPEERAVPNSLSLRAQTCVITGSNMSGKTTFLRSVGVNLALAYAGGPVCARRFSASCMAVFTSMRVHDDVSQGISTFYAELLRIKSMVQYSEKQLPMLALIDEIFKGTNSADRVLGATETIRRLSQPWCMCLVSTHDFELCALKDDPGICAVNHHFAEFYENDEIHFDYKIRTGRCQTTNARQLMKMVGILK